ncbi:MAG: OB-fold domain-containing protein [Candidatus Bathyarchaeota archaeon]|jgi:uncharacterized OB-fold protein|nr:OB-fold domain-containing protein [Candidatus Bathyarchaeota archaeon]
MVEREPTEIREHYVLTSADYEKGLKEGKLLGLRCKDCKQTTCPPMIVCQRCGSKELEKTELSGEGELMTFTVIRIPPEGYEAPYIVCLVKTKEGPWIIGRLDYDTEKMSQKLLGKKVRVKGVYAHVDKYSGGEHVCPVFEILQ